MNKLAKTPTGPRRDPRHDIAVRAGGDRPVTAKNLLEPSPEIEARLRDDANNPVFASMCDRIHAHGGLVGIVSCHDGLATPNRMSREVSIGPSARPVTDLEPMRGRAMDKADIRAVRRIHFKAAKRARRAARSSARRGRR